MFRTVCSVLALSVAAVATPVVAQPAAPAAAVAPSEDARLAAFPYLADDYAFSERTPGATPWLRNVHLFAIGSTMSFGASGSSINALSTAIPKLVSGLTRGLFRDDVEAHWASLRAYDVPQAIITPRQPG